VYSRLPADILDYYNRHTYTIYHTSFVKQTVSLFETMRLNSTVGYNQSQQVFKVFYFGLHTGLESFSTLIGRFVNNHMFKISPHHHQSLLVAMETAGGSQQH